MKNIANFLKLVPGVRQGANIYRGTKFIRRALRLRRRLAKFDSKMPFKGSLAPLGFDRFDVSEKALVSLKKLAFKNGVSEKERYFSVLFSKSETDAIRELFDKISPKVRAYLGPEAYLDGINWSVSNRDEKSISQNWHTDNVGNRLKVFVCISGDRSQPTYVIPSKRRIPKTFDWILSTLLESKRWFGLVNQMALKNECKLEHETGSVYIFDTQLLHRGSYDTAKSERVILHMEFSVPEKHDIARGPIGTQAINSFKFDDDALSILSFNELLDPKRTKKLKNRFVYSN